MKTRKHTQMRRSILAAGLIAGLGLSIPAMSVEAPEVDDRVAQLEARIAALESAQSESGEETRASTNRDLNNNASSFRGGKMVPETDFWSDYWEQQKRDGN